LEAVLVAEADGSDSSQGRAIETPSPRNMVRRETGKADPMGMGTFRYGKGRFVAWLFSQHHLVVT
jgi:hypothetical protein